MKTFYTIIKAICPKSGETKTYEGLKIISTNVDEAQEYCDNNGLGYCRVIGEFITSNEQSELN